MKLIYTPRGFDGCLINQIQKTKKENGVFAAWIKCLNLGLMKVPTAQAAGDIANIRQTLTRLIQKYVEEPALLRNKMMHGQWVVAFNRENTSVNSDISQKIEDIDVVKLMILKNATGIVANCIELLIQSPHKHFRSSIRSIICEHDQQLTKQSNWSLEQKVAKLKARAPKSRTVGY